jgi:hypothetical protein
LAELDEPVPDELLAAAVEDEEEHPAAARTVAVTTPARPARRRTRGRRCVRFMGTECGEPKKTAGDVKLAARRIDGHNLALTLVSS